MFAGLLVDWHYPGQQLRKILKNNEKDNTMKVLFSMRLLAKLGQNRERNCQFILLATEKPEANFEVPEQI